MPAGQRVQRRERWGMADAEGRGKKGLADGLLRLLIILVVASEEGGPPDEDLPSGWLCVGVVPQLLGALKAQLQGRQGRAHGAAVAGPGQCNEGGAAGLGQAIPLDIRIRWSSSQVGSTAPD